MGLIYIYRQEIKSSCHHFIDKQKHIVCTRILCGLVISLCLYLVHFQLYCLSAKHCGLSVKVFSSDGEYGCVKFQGVIYFEPSKLICGDYIGGGVSLREHILDFQTAFNIPFGHIVISHCLLHFLSEKLGCFSLSGYLHYLEGKIRVNAVIYKIGHNTVTAADNLGYCTYAVFDKILCISQPYVSSMGKSRDLEQVGKSCGLSVKKHLHSKACSHFGNGKSSCLPADVLCCNTQSLGRQIKAHDLFVCRENVLGIYSRHILKVLVKRGHIVSKLVKLENGIVEGMEVKVSGYKA